MPRLLEEMAREHRLVERQEAGRVEDVALDGISRRAHGGPLADRITDDLESGGRIAQPIVREDGPAFDRHDPSIAHHIATEESCAAIAIGEDETHRGRV